MRLYLATAVALLASGVPALSATDSWTAWRTDVQNQCPQNHLDWLPDGTYDDFIASFTDTLSVKLKRKIASAANVTHWCTPENAGLACEMVAYTAAFDRFHLLHRFATFSCTQWKCSEASICARL